MTLIKETCLTPADQAVQNAFEAAGVALIDWAWAVPPSRIKSSSIDRDLFVAGAILRRAVSKLTVERARAGDPDSRKRRRQLTHKDTTSTLAEKALRHAANAAATAIIDWAAAVAKHRLKPGSTDMTVYLAAAALLRAAKIPVEEEESGSVVK